MRIPQTKKKKTESGNKKQRNKKRYKVRNWREHNEALVNRGRLIFHITEEAMRQWEEKNSKQGEASKKRKPGRPKKFSDTAIETTIAIGQYFRLPLRSTQGVVSNILSHMGSECSCPDYTTLSIRGRNLSVSVRIRSLRENVHIAVDSTGIKVFGEGEWKVRKHGWSKHRSWPEVHLGVDETTGDILAGEVTDNTVHDSEMIEPLLSQIPDAHAIAQFSADGAYDTKKGYDTIMERDVSKITIPPQRNAKIWKHGNSKGIPHPRDVNLR